MSWHDCVVDPRVATAKTLFASCTLRDPPFVICMEGHLVGSAVRFHTDIVARPVGVTLTSVMRSVHIWILNVTAARLML